MPKNVSGGNKAKKQKSGVKRKVIVADELCENQLFGVIVSKSGGGFFVVKCSDNLQRLGKLGPLLRKNKNPDARIVVGSHVIVELRECDTNKTRCDIITLANPPHSVLNMFKDKEENENDTMYRFVDDERDDRQYDYDVDDL